MQLLRALTIGLLALSVVMTLLVMNRAGERRPVIYAWRVWPYAAALIALALNFLQDNRLRLAGLVAVVVVTVATLGWVRVAFRRSLSPDFWRWATPARTSR